jgi:hypothetical protein
MSQLELPDDIKDIILKKIIEIHLKSPEHRRLLQDIKTYNYLPRRLKILNCDNNALTTGLDFNLPLMPLILSDWHLSIIH